jgi:hypothetical protein
MLRHISLVTIALARRHWQAIRERLPNAGPEHVGAWEEIDGN